MAEQQRKEKQASAPQEEVEEVEAKDLSNEALADDVEDLLADIDDLLEENAEEFVSNYKQRGGQ
jgi:ubiquitin-like protein Pup